MKISVLNNRHVLIGVTGSIAAYKAADLASKLAQAGTQVDVIMTDAARQFIAPLTFQSLISGSVFTDSDLWGRKAHILHVDLAHHAELLVIAPATANTIAHIANGLADSLLSMTALAARCPVIIAPAMDAGMFENPATQANLRTLEQRGIIVIGPAEGRLASGLSGAGRMMEPKQILGHIRRVLGEGGALAGCNVVVTAGGTQETIDPVRMITNRSSGKQGFALAQAALDRGATVTLIAAPTGLPTPVGARRIDVRTAAEMTKAVLSAREKADALLMAAAVADFTPAKSTDQKIRKSGEGMYLELLPTQDILSLVAEGRQKDGWPKIVVGFAAESQDLIENAKKKLKKKHLSMIVANDITATDAGFEVDSNRVTLIQASGNVQALPLIPKMAVAEAVLDQVENLLKGKG